MNPPWWLSGLRRHAFSQLSVATEGPRLGSLLRITILIAHKYKYFVANQIAGHQVTCVAYNFKPSVDANRHAQCA